MPISPGASLSRVMDELTTLHGEVHEDLRVYRWRPRSRLELPAIYCWMDPSAAEWTDTVKHRDVLELIAMVAVEHSDIDEQMAKVEVYADRYREVIDAAFNETGPLGGVRSAERQNMQPLVDTFEQGQVVLCIGFLLEVQLDRLVF